MRRLAVAFAVLLAVLLPGSAAWAHNQLLDATPADGSILTGAPASVTLRFAERLNPDFTTIAVSDSARQRVPTGPLSASGASGTVTLDGPLANGGYTVAYRTVSVDGHVVQGSYRFTVADPARPAAVEAATPAPASGSGPRTAILIGVGAALAVALAIAAFAFRRRR